MRILEHKTGAKKYGDFVVKDGKMLFNRVGPVNAQYQKKNKSVPVKRGVWAFPYPIFDYYFVGAPFSAPTKHAPARNSVVTLTDEDKVKFNTILKGKKARYASQPQWSDEKYDISAIENGLKEGKMHASTYSHLLRKTKYKNANKIRRFYWSGEVYARFCPKGYETDVLYNEMGWYRYDNIHDYIEELRKHLISFSNAKKAWGGDPNKFLKMGVRIVGNRDCNLSEDHLEVFIPMIA